MDRPEVVQTRSEGIGGVAMESKGRVVKQAVATAHTKLEEEAEIGSELGLALGGGNGSSSVSPLKNPSAIAQLTIFYDGSVNVYDSISPEKAQAIMLIAAAAAAAAASSGNNLSMNRAPSRAGQNPATISSPTLTRSLSQQSSSTALSPQTQHPSNPSPYLCKLQTELPVARRHSLQRFLEKRRDRFVSRAPYVSEKSPNGMDVGADAKPAGVN